MFFVIFLPGRELKVRMGERDVVVGLEQGLVGMRKGGRRIVVVPAALGYGAAGLAGKVPSSTNNSKIIINWVLCCNRRNVSTHRRRHARVRRLCDKVEVARRRARCSSRRTVSFEIIFFLTNLLFF